MTKKEVELIVFYLETEIRNLKFFIQKSYKQHNEQEMNFFLEKLKQNMDKLAEYQQTLRQFED
jgi:hypothetical protein